MVGEEGASMFCPLCAFFTFEFCVSVLSFVFLFWVLWFCFEFCVSILDFVILFWILWFCFEFCDSVLNFVILFWVLWFCFEFCDSVLFRRRKIRSYTPVVPSKTTPDSRPNGAKCIPVFRPKRRKTPTRWGGGGAHTYMAYMMEYPPPSPRQPAHSRIFLWFNWKTWVQFHVKNIFRSILMGRLRFLSPSASGQQLFTVPYFSVRPLRLKSSVTGGHLGWVSNLLRGRGTVWEEERKKNSSPSP